MYLSKLADIVVGIDEGKNITDANVVSMTDSGIRLVAQMKSLGLDVGTLQETFAGMQLMCGNRAVLTELIDRGAQSHFASVGFAEACRH